jgi:hypothetical protein
LAPPPGCPDPTKHVFALSLPPLNPERWLGGRGMEAHCHPAGGAPERTAAASTGFVCASWTCTKTKWSSSRRHPTLSFSGPRGAADRWVWTASPPTPGPLQLLSFCPPLSWQDICSNYPALASLCPRPHSERFTDSFFLLAQQHSCSTNIFWSPTVCRALLKVLECLGEPKSLFCLHPGIGETEAEGG